MTYFAASRLIFPVSAQWPLAWLGHGDGNLAGGAVYADIISLTFLIVLLAVITYIDIKKMLIPDKLIIVGFAGLLPLIAAKCLYYKTLSFFLTSALGFVAGGAPIMLVIIISRGGMGAGDMKLAAMAGAFIGPKLALLMLFISVMTGGLWGVCLILLKKKTLNSKIPFGPFIAAGALIAVFFGEAIISNFFAF